MKGAVVQTQAYINHGRWVADCPAADCNSAMELRGSQPPDMQQWQQHVAKRTVDDDPEDYIWRRTAVFHCYDCRQIARIEWPENDQELLSVLMERANAANRNWYPTGHPFASTHGYPCGQSVTELRAEALQHA